MNTVTHWIRHWATETPNRTYMIAPEPGRRVTYAELQGFVEHFAAHFDAMGIKPGDHVATLMDNGQWTGLMFLCTMASGRVTVPLNAISGDSQLEYVLEHCDADVLFASGQHLERARKISRKAGRPIKVILCDTDDGPEWPHGASSSAAALPETTPDDKALLIYTSGTTGKPKGALLSHGNVIGGGLNAVQAHDLTPEDRTLCVLPLYHINGEIVSVVAPLVSGGSIVMPHRFSAKAFWDLAMEYECTWASIVPTIVSYLLARAESEPRPIKGNPALSQFRFARSASSALPPEVHHAFEREFGLLMVETMGLSETAAQILSNPMPPTPCKYGSPGVPVRNQVKTIRDDGSDADADERGELVVRGDNVLREYYKNPEATDKAFTSDGWFRTGDLGYRDKDGFFFITGRSKELIIKGGENIAPREIDEALLKHPAVLEAAAYAEADSNYGQEVMACVVLKPGKQTSPDELREFAREELGKYKAPKQVHIVDWLPKGPSGKVQRLRIPDILDDLTGKPEQASFGA